MDTTDDEIEVNGITYVRKRYEVIVETDSYRCGISDCQLGASITPKLRNTVLVRDDLGPCDDVFFTCANGHRNRLKI